MPTKNLRLARSLGAGHVIDYTAEDFTSNGQTYDVIYDAVGKHSFRCCKGSLRRGGIYLSADGSLNLVLALRPARAESKKVMLAIPPRYARQDLLPSNRGSREGRLPSAQTGALRGILAPWLTTLHGTWPSTTP